MGHSPPVQYFTTFKLESAPYLALLRTIAHSGGDLTCLSFALLSIWVLSYLQCSWLVSLILHTQSMISQLEPNQNRLTHLHLIFASRAGRYLECAVYVAILSFAFTFPDAWASKFCSLSCSIGIRYLFWSGPALHPRAEIIRTGQPSKQTGMFKNLMRAYSTFCFGTAKLE